MSRWLFATLVLLVPQFAVAQLPADLAAVHPDALGFVHVRVSDVWKHDALKDARSLLAKAGERALTALDDQFAPRPSTAERMTAIFLLPDGNARVDPNFPVRILGALRFSAPFDKTAVRQSFIGGGTAKKAGTKDYFADEQSQAALYFPDDRTLVISDDKTMAEYLTWAPKNEGGLSEAIKAASGNAPMTAALNLTRLPIPPEALEQVPAEFQPLVKAQLLTLTMDLGKEVTLKTKLSFANEADALQGEKSLRRAAEMGRQQLVRPRQEAEQALYKKPKEGPRPIDEFPEAFGGVAALAAINLADELLADPPIKREGSALTASVVLPQWTTPYVGMSALSAGLAIPAIQKVREAAARASASNNLKQIALAMHNHESAYQYFPPAAIVDKKGKKLLSWRVQILPFIEHENLYKQFKLDEPWDSEHNMKLVRLMPKVYADPRASAEPGKTYYKVFVGETAGFDWVKTRKITDFLDGTSNTIMVAAAGEPVIWTKPDDFEFDPKGKLPDLTKPFANILVAMFDGSVRTLTPKTSEKTLRALIGRNDGEVPDFDK